MLIKLYQEIILKFKFRKKNYVKINDDSCGTYRVGSQVKILMLNSGLCDYSGAYIPVNGIISTAELAEGRGKNNEKQYLKIVLHLLIA